MNAVHFLFFAFFAKKRVFWPAGLFPLDHVLEKCYLPGPEAGPADRIFQAHGLREKGSGEQSVRQHWEWRSRLRVQCPYIFVIQGVPSSGQTWLQAFVSGKESGGWGDEKGEAGSHRGCQSRARSQCPCSSVAQGVQVFEYQWH